MIERSKLINPLAAKLKNRRFNHWRTVKMQNRLKYKMGCKINQISSNYKRDKKKYRTHTKMMVWRKAKNKVQYNWK